MATRTGFNDAELNEAVRRLNELPGLIASERQRLLKWAALPMLDAIKRKAPKSDRTRRRYKDGKVAGTDTPGNLRRSLRYLPFRRSKSKVYLGPVFGKNKKQNADGWYAHFVEFGTSKQPPRPFMRPAFYENRDLVLSRFRQALSGEVKAWAASLSRRKLRR